MSGEGLPVVLCFASRYLPGFKGGGPIRTIANMVAALEKDVHFRIVTEDRDLGDDTPYPGIRTDRWTPVGGAQVWYTSPGRSTPGAFAALATATPHDILYLNSAFDPSYTIGPLVMRRFGRFPRRPTVLAPRGEFARGAMALKPVKKRVYLAAARALELFRGVAWQASTSFEAGDVRRVVGYGADVRVAPDLLAAPEGPEVVRGGTKEVGRLRIVFVGRISPMKNLEGAVAMLRGLQGDVTFDVYGPFEDRALAEACGRLARDLEPHVRVRLHGPIEPHRVGPVLASHDLLLLPSRGENFGHVVLEALAAGCPVLVSDRTPWRGLAEEGVGWDLPLERMDRFREVLKGCVAMSAEEHGRMSRRARGYALRHRGEAAVAANRSLFGDLLDADTKERTLTP